MFAHVAIIYVHGRHKLFAYTIIHCVPIQFSMASYVTSFPCRLFVTYIEHYPTCTKQHCI